MGFLDFFKRKKKEDESLNPLENLKKGDIVEFDGETWEVVGVAEYRYKGSVEKEWEVRSARRKGFLSYEEGKIYFFEEIDLNSIEPNIVSHYRRCKEPPETVRVGNKEFKLKFAGKAVYRKGSESYPVEVWEFISDDGEMIDVEIWDEYEIEASKGRELKEWEIEGIFRR